MSLPDDTLLTSLFNSGLILRQKEMHFFLKRFLQLYSSSCIDEFPKELFQVIENPSFPEKFLYDSSSKVMFQNVICFCKTSQNHPYISERSTLTSMLAQRFLVPSEFLGRLVSVLPEKGQPDILDFLFSYVLFCYSHKSSKCLRIFYIPTHNSISQGVILPRSYTNFNIITL